MTLIDYIVLAIAAVVALGVMFYNRLVALRLSCGRAMADIDVQLKQRYDLIPNLVETVKGYATHENEVFTKVTEARATAMKAQAVVDRAPAEAALSGALMQLMAISENYPELKANQNFQQLQSDLSDLENKIAAARRFFNNAVTEYNTSIEQFPSVVVAKLFKFDPYAIFELGEERKTVEAAPKVSFNK